MPTQREFDELRELVLRIADTPKVRGYLNGAPQRFDGLIVPVNEVALAVPKSKELVHAEMVEGECQAAFDKAKQAWLDASAPESGTFESYVEAGGVRQGLPVRYEVAPQEMIQGKLDIPEYAALQAAERALISARVRMYRLQKQREQAMIEHDRKRNPIKNPSEKPDGGFVTRVVKLASGR